MLAPVGGKVNVGIVDEEDELVVLDKGGGEEGAVGGCEGEGE